MKLQSIFFLMGMVAFGSCGHEDEFDIKESEVPPGVMAALKAKYPNAQVQKWQAEKDDGKFVFEAEIKIGNDKKDIQISPDGSSVEEEK